MDQLRERTGKSMTAQAALPPRSKALGTAFIEFAIDEDDDAGIREAAARPRLRAGRRARFEVGDALDARRRSTSSSTTRRRASRTPSTSPTARRSARSGSRSPTPRRRSTGRSGCSTSRSARRSDRANSRSRRCAASAAASSTSSIRRAISAGSGTSSSSRPAKTPPPTTAACAVVDHISQSMHYEEMLTWLLFYTSLLDLEKLAEQDVIDPGGLVKSQVVQSADGSLRIVLNASQSSHTQSSQVPRRRVRLGRAAHRVRHRRHVDDREAAAGERRPAAADPGELLRRPRGQDRSVARADRANSRRTTCSTTARATAEFLQVYTQTFDGGFFFEIVERRGYKGFGAGERADPARGAGPPRAPGRHAAQLRPGRYRPLSR